MITCWMAAPANGCRLPVFNGRLVLPGAEAGEKSGSSRCRVAIRRFRRRFRWLGGRLAASLRSGRGWRFRSRRCCGVTSISSSCRMNSIDCSNRHAQGRDDLFIGIRTQPRACSSRFFSFVIFTSRSVSRLFSPTSMPPYTTSVGSTNSCPLTCRLIIEYPVTRPVRSATSAPVVRWTMSPAQGRYSVNMCVRMPVPFVSVRNSVR